MEIKEREKNVIEKANFFRLNDLQAHVLTIPKGTFKNGMFKSNIQDGDFFWFKEIDQEIDKRLFLCDIFDIEEYTPRGILK